MKKAKRKRKVEAVRPLMVAAKIVELLKPLDDESRRRVLIAASVLVGLPIPEELLPKRAKP